MFNFQQCMGISLLLLAFTLGTTNSEAQSIFDRFEKFLVSRNLQLSYGVQASIYKNSNIHFVQEKYGRNLMIHHVSAKDRNYSSSLLKGEFGVVQFKVNAEIDLSPNYSFVFTGTHLAYHVDVNKAYYQLGTWNNEHVSANELLNKDFEQLEHSNGINLINIALKRRIRLTKDEDRTFKFELGLMPNVGLLFAATQASVFNPDGIIERYDPGNELAGYNYGIESVYRVYIKQHFLVGLNINYFLMEVIHAELEPTSYVEQQIRGVNYGLNVGYRF